MDSLLPNSEVAVPQRQCWECLRRRLVCDSARPVCYKCKASGLVCPGYDDKKPLKWLSPGTVTYRPRRNRRRGPAPADKSSVVAKMEPADEEEHAAETTREAIPTVSRFELASETCDIVRVVSFYNSDIYPDWASAELETTGYIIKLPMAALHNFSPSLRHSLVFCGLSYRLNQLHQSTDYDAITQAKSKLYHHRGAAIRALSEEIANEESRTSDKTINSVLVFLFVDIRQSTGANWRHHFDGLLQMMMLRGGPDKLFKQNPNYRVTLVLFTILGVMANTTSPALDQVTPKYHLDYLEFITELYGDGLYPTLLCAPPLFVEIIKINNLRLQAAKGNTGNGMLEALARETLRNISAFSPQRWADSFPSLSNKLLRLGQIYQSALNLYCISSLQSVSILSDTVELRKRRATHYSRLLPLLGPALASHQMKKAMLWPLIVTGMEASHGTLAERTLLGDYFSEMKAGLHTSLPLLAKSVLEKFWASGKIAWDDCFDRPYAFVT